LRGASGLLEGPESIGDWPAGTPPPGWLMLAAAENALILRKRARLPRGPEHEQTGHPQGWTDWQAACRRADRDLAGRAGGMGAAPAPDPAPAAGGGRRRGRARRPSPVQSAVREGGQREQPGSDEAAPARALLGRHLYRPRVQGLRGLQGALAEDARRAPGK